MQIIYLLTHSFYKQFLKHHITKEMALQLLRKHKIISKIITFSVIFF